MKKLLITLMLSFLSLLIFAQSPNNFNYQGVARDAQNQILQQKKIGLQISVLSGSSNGNIVFSEEHFITTSELGIFSIQIGTGQNSNGTISGVNWGNGSYWLQIKMDVSGGSNFVLMGASQLVSVPYALHAETVSNVDDADANPSNELQQISKNGNLILLSQNGGSITDEVDDADSDPNNEIQTIGFDVSTNILTLTNGGQVDLTSLDNDGGGSGSGTDDQTISLNGTTLSIEDGNAVDLSVIQDGVNDADSDSQNEIQHLNLAGEILEITNGNSVDLSGLNNSPWKTIPQTDKIEFKKNDPKAIITDGTNDLQLSQKDLVITDNTKFKTYLFNGDLSFDEFETKPNGILHITEAMRLNVDSLGFNDYKTNDSTYASSSFSNEKLRIDYDSGLDFWKVNLDPVSLSYKVNDETYGSYDAFGMHVITNKAFGFKNDWEVYLKPEDGLYMGEKIGGDTINASLVTNNGFYLGNGPGFGSLTQNYTYLNKDSLTFNRMLTNGVSSGFTSLSRDELTFNTQVGALLNTSCLSPYNLCFNNKLGNQPTTGMNLDFETLEFSKNLIGNSAKTSIGIDSVYLTSQIGLLLPVRANLKPYELTFDDLDFKSNFSRYGMEVLQSISQNDIFQRITLHPDNFTMYNSAKWKTFSIETNPNNYHGELSLYGDGNLPHTEIKSGNDGPYLEMHNTGDLRVGFWGFSDFGLINTIGKNGFQNTYIGTAETHDNRNMGGMGVMDNLGLIKAGIEVDEFGKGLVYSDGCFKIINLSGKEVSCSNEDGYTIYRENGESKAGIGGSLFSTKIGEVYTKGEQGEYSFYAGSNMVYNGDFTTGFAGVYDGNGVAKSGMFVNSDKDGFLFADQIQVGAAPDANSNYPMNIVQNNSYGLNLVKNDLSSNWEFFVNVDNTLSLFYKDLLKGTFNPTTGAYTAISDKRLKQNIRGLNNVLSKVSTLNPRRYTYKNNNKNQRESLGFIAQEIREIFPELVYESTDERSKGLLTVDYSGFGVIAIKAIQEQQKTIEMQQTKINNLEKRLERIENMLNNK